MSLSYGNVDGDEDQLWIYDDSGERSRIVYDYEDQIRTSLAMFLVEAGLAFLWIAAFVFSAVSLLVRGILCLVRICRKRGVSAENIHGKKKSGLWSAGAAVLQLTALLPCFCSCTMFPRMRWGIHMYGYLWRSGSLPLSWVCCAYMD